MVKLIALDLDGTLLDPNGVVTQKAKEAIRTAREAGVKVVLSTGRAVPEALYFTREAGCDELYCCLGGAALVDGEAGKTLLRHDIPEPSGTRVLELCLNREIELMIFAGEQILLDPYSKQSLSRTYHYPVFHDNAVVTPDPIAYMKEHGLPLTKLHGDYGVFPLEELRALPGVELTSSNDHDFELVKEGVDKGKTLIQLARYYGIAPEECAAVGDSDNDLAMLRVVGTPIAMGNASQRVKNVCCRVAPSNAQEGVAAAILSCLN